MKTEYMKVIKDKRVWTVAGIIVGILLIAWLMAEPKVAVKIYKHTESGNYIYCETGTLNDEFHTYEGEGKIAESKAVAC
jgi:hypothetical protein